MSDKIKIGSIATAVDNIGEGTKLEVYLSRFILETHLGLKIEDHLNNWTALGKKDPLYVLKNSDRDYPFSVDQLTLIGQTLAHALTSNNSIKVSDGGTDLFHIKLTEEDVSFVLFDLNGNRIDTFSKKRN